MTGLQSGTPAGALAPQNYSNSSQDTVFQNATGRATFQATPSTAQTLQTNPRSGLQVASPAQTGQVLGIDTVALNRQATKESTSTLVFPMVLLAIVSLLAFGYFWRRLNSLQFEKVENHEKPTDNKQD